MSVGALSGSFHSAATGDAVSGSGMLSVYEQYGRDMATVDIAAPSGTYLIDPLYASPYYAAYASADDYSLQIVDPVAVKAGEITRQDFYLRYAGAMSGTVADAWGNPIRGASVTALQSDWPYLGGGFATTDVSGSYTIYDLDIDSGGSNYAVQVIAPGYTSLVYQDVYVQQPDKPHTITAVIHYRLQPAGTIFGTVKDSGGNPVPGAIALASPAATGATRTAQAVTDANGDYAISELDGGMNYVVLYRALGFSETSTSGYLGNGGSLLLDVYLPPVAKVTGTVRLSDQTPIAGAAVWWWDSADPSLIGSGVYSDSNGIYELDISAPATVDVEAFTETASGTVPSISVTPGQTIQQDIFVSS